MFSLTKLFKKWILLMNQFNNYYPTVLVFHYSANILNLNLQSYLIMNEKENESPEQR